MLKIVVYIVSVTEIYAGICTTPNNEVAGCKSLYLCPTLLEGLLTQNPKVIEFVKDSYCGNSVNEPFVCCGSSYNYIDSKATLKNICGYQHSDDYYRTDIVSATIDEFPWIAQLKYKRDPDLDQDESDPFFYEYGCAGALISELFVLTAAHCLKMRTSTAVGVRIGEYNTREAPDCIKSGLFKVCADPVQDYEIKSKIKHPNYNRRYGLNDIALLKLTVSVMFSDYIRPICLPTSNKNYAKVGEIMQFSGFGRLSDNGTFAHIKKKVLGNLISNEECASYFVNTVGMLRNVTENSLCVKELSTNTIHFCEGDSGGPIMFSNKKQWHVEGVAAWSGTGCNGLLPAVYTRVSMYLSWIEDTVRMK